MVPISREMYQKELPIQTLLAGFSEEEPAQEPSIEKPENGGVTNIITSPNKKKYKIIESTCAPKNIKIQNAKKIVKPYHKTK